MAQDDVIKLPRIYVEDDLREGGAASLGSAHAHYLCNVLRARAGDSVRLFNGRDGEWRGVLESAGKKDVTIRLARKIKDQPPAPREVRLFFAPVKKARMDWLVEKAVELGATHLHPVLTQNTEVRAINEERIRAQIVEAVEQCERMDVPALFPLQPFLKAVGDVKIYACLERSDLPSLQGVVRRDGALAFLIGPEGGFTTEEKERILEMENVTGVSLGPRVLRSETAAIVALCAAGS